MKQRKEEDYLYLKLSQIPNAGTGLFTRINIRKGQFISAFKGERIDYDEAYNRIDDGLDQYFVDMGDETILDSIFTPCFAKYANDADGLSKSPFSNNAQIRLDGKGGVALYALRSIKAGEEIFTAYGQEYWDNVRSRIE